MYILNSSIITFNNFEKLRTFNQDSPIANLSRFRNPEGSMININRPLNISGINNSINMRSTIWEKGDLSNPGNR